MSEIDENKRNEIFERVCANLTEWFPDFLVMARMSKSGVMTRRSDATWARGAIERFKDFEGEDDKIDREFSAKRVNQNE